MFTVGSKIKIKPELCPVEKLTEKEFQFGDLGYLPLMLDWEMEVLRLFTDEYHGEMAEVKVLNDDLKANVFMKIAECIQAAPSKIKINYEILGKSNPFADKIQALKTKEADILAKREELKKKGLAASHSSLKQNWSLRQDVKSEIAKLEKNKEITTKVRVGKQVFNIANFNEETIQQELYKLIRRSRIETKSIPTSDKKVFNTDLSYKKIGKVMSEAGQILKLSGELGENLLDMTKKPSNTDKYVGLEIEMLTSSSMEEFRKQMIANRLHKYVDITSDGSIKIDQSGANALELRVLVKETELRPVLEKLCKVMKKLDCYVNRSCGLHVHLDMRERDVSKAYSKLFNVQDIMLATQPAARTNSKFCKPNTVEKVTKSALREGNVKLAGEGEARYSAINANSYSRHETIEVRLHEGTVKFNDIYNWTTFLIDVVDSSIKTKVTKLDELQGIINAESYTHINNRIAEQAS